MTLRFVAVLMILLGGVGLPAQAASTDGSSTAGAHQRTQASSRYQTRLLRQINVERAAAGRRAIKRVDGCADTMATRWAVHLASIETLVHRDQTEVLEACDFVWAGETLVRGTDLGPRRAVGAWMDSPPHRAVLLMARARVAGIGVRVRDGVVYVVLNLGRPT
ncbi:MAG: hypothetical protein F2667_10120 [Actinobacteria bacterium]|uniref:Unannotated protein n=1 Tax=freshwater metagenome TaxID=449393 RepID=A0A6J6RKQ3_9ZZZZ|nr:hypothetical protein [Actinomycetota bacterium]